MGYWNRLKKLMAVKGNSLFLLDKKGFCCTIRGIGHKSNGRLGLTRAIRGVVVKASFIVRNTTFASILH